MPRPTLSEIRDELFTVIEQQRPKHPNDTPLQHPVVIEGLNKRLNIQSYGLDQVVLTLFHDLMRTGYFAWGYNLTNPGPPFFHVTDRGVRALDVGTRDPINPDGYRRHLASLATLNPIAASYLEEALACFGAGLFKSAAVMIGASAESLILELRDVIVQRLKKLHQTPPPGMKDWRVKTVLDSLEALFRSKLSSLPRGLREGYEAYWPAFTQQIRATRNEAGHPSSVDPVTEDAVHASFLVFPLLAKLALDLGSWAKRGLR